VKKLKLGLAAAALAVFLLAPNSSRADIVIKLDNPTAYYTAGFGATYDVTGVITNTSATQSETIDSDSLAGPYQLFNPSPTAPTPDTLVQYNKDGDPFLSLIPSGGLTLAPGANTGDIDLVEVTQGPQYESAATAFGPGGDYYAQDYTYGYFTVADNAGNPSNTVTFGTAAPEFSTVAMMMTGAGGLFTQLVRQRRRVKKVVA